MILTKKILQLLTLFLISNFLYASSITQRGNIEYFSMEKRKIEVNITVNNVSLIKQSYPLDLSKVKVWWKNKRLYIGRLEKGMKIEFKSNKGKIYNIKVLDNNGYNLEPEG